MPYKLENHTIVHDGKVVATVIDAESSDTGIRLVGLLNLAERDERLLDDLGDQIDNRNLDE